MEVLREMKKKPDLSSHKGTIVHDTCIDKSNGYHVHILEFVLNERALKIYFPKLHNSFTLLTLTHLL